MPSRSRTIGGLLQVLVVFGGQNVLKTGKSRSLKYQELEKPWMFFSG